MILRRRCMAGPFQISRKGCWVMLPITRCRQGDTVPSGRMRQLRHRFKIHAQNGLLE